MGQHDRVTPTLTPYTRSTEPRYNFQGRLRRSDLSRSVGPAQCPLSVHLTTPFVPGAFVGGNLREQAASRRFNCSYLNFRVGRDPASDSARHRFGS